MLAMEWTCQSVRNNLLGWSKLSGSSTIASSLPRPNSHRNSSRNASLSGSQMLESGTHKGGNKCREYFLRPYRNVSPLLSEGSQKDSEQPLHPREFAALQVLPSSSAEKVLLLGPEKYLSH